MTAQSDSTPIAQGNLQETPFAHILIYVYRRGNTASSNSGTLVLQVQAGECKVRMQRGRPIMARVPWPSRYLFDALLPLCGFRTGTYAFYQDDRLTGEPTTISGNVDPYSLIAASLDKYAREDAIDTVLQRFGSMRLRMPPNRELDRLRLDARDTPFIDMLRAAPATLDELLRQSPLPAERTRRVLYALIITQMVLPHDDPTQHTVRTQTPATVSRDLASATQRPSRRSSPAWRVLASLRPDLSVRMDSGSLRPDGSPSARPLNSTTPPGGGPSMRPSGPVPPNNANTLRPPGASPNTANTVRPAGPATSLRPPTSVPASAVNSLRPSAAPAQDAATLRPPGKATSSSFTSLPAASAAPGAGTSARASGPAPGSTSGRPSGPAPGSATSGRPSGPAPTLSGPPSNAPEDIPARIRRAEALMQRRRHDEALTEVDAMLQLEPDRAELHGLRAQVLFEKHTDAEGLPRAVIDSLKRALEIDPDQTRALFTRGLVCKRGGDLKKAITYFKRVLSVDPKHLDAQRELRLAKLRE